jgi:hypothetical protein
MPLPLAEKSRGLEWDLLKMFTGIRVFLRYSRSRMQREQRPISSWSVVPLSVHPLFRSSALPPSHLRASSLLFREVNLDHLIGSNPEFTSPSVVYSGEPGPQNISHRQVSARPRGPRTGWPRWPKSYISRFPFPFPFLSAHFTSSSISYDTLLQIPCNGN